METKKKGKEGTKGAKQIVEENKSTLRFYLYMILGASGFYGILRLVFFSGSLSWGTIFLTALVWLGSAAAFQFMKMMSTPKYSDSGALLDSGTDLNLEGGIAEHVKDLIIVFSLTQVLSLISGYFWLVLLAIPARAFILLWGSVIKPWMQAKNEQPEVDEKKQKKLERRMKRRQY